jgi:hypothetical protein
MSVHLSNASYFDEDGGIPTEEVLAEMRACDPPVQYLVGAPKGRLGATEVSLASLPWERSVSGTVLGLRRLRLRSRCLLRRFVVVVLYL